MQKVRIFKRKDNTNFNIYLVSDFSENANVYDCIFNVESISKEMCNKMKEFCETFSYYGIFETKHNTKIKIYKDTESEDYFVLWCENE